MKLIFLFNLLLFVFVVVNALLVDSYIISFNKNQLKLNYNKIISINNDISLIKLYSKKSKGFGKSKQITKKQTNSVDQTTNNNKGNELKNNINSDTSNKLVIKTTSESSNSEINDVDSLFNKYGMKDTIKSKKVEEPIGERPFGEKVISKIPEKTQMKLDSVLLTGTFISLSLVILSGIGISYGAFKVVFPTIVIPESLDSFIINVLTPSFTWTTAVFFLFSITYGLFKFAQASSYDTIYREK